MTHLIPVETLIDGGVARLALPQHEWRHRESSKLTDAGMNLNAALDPTRYYIKCHEPGKGLVLNRIEGKRRATLRRAPSE